MILDSRSLALMRRAVGAVIVLDVLLRSRDLTAHYTDAGVLPRTLLWESDFWSSLWFSLHVTHGHALFQAVLMALQVAAAVALVANVRPRIATAVSLVLAWSLQARNPLVLDGGDTLLRLVLLWGLLLPWGEREPRRLLTPATVGYTLQISVLYWFAAAFKLAPAWTSRATALYSTLALDQFVTPLGRLLWGHPELLQWLTRGVVALEFTAPLLLFIPRLRPAGLVLLACLHLGSALVLNLGLFPLISLVALLAFLPSRLWGALEPPLETSRKQWLPALVLIALVVWWNAGTLSPSLRPPRPVQAVALLLHLEQRWNLFAPEPFTEEGWYVAVGTTTDGRQVDLFRLQGEPVWEKPSSWSVFHPNQRWRMYLQTLERTEDPALRTRLARWLAARWNARHPDRKLAWVQLYFMAETTLPDYQVAPPRRVQWVELNVGDTSSHG